MASNLMLRLCQDDSVNQNKHINIHMFVSVLWDRFSGVYSDNDIKARLKLTGQDAKGFDTLVGKIDSASNAVTKIARIKRIESILGYHEQHDKTRFALSPFNTPDKIQSELLAIDSINIT